MRSCRVLLASIPRREPRPCLLTATRPDTLQREALESSRKLHRNFGRLGASCLGAMVMGAPTDAARCASPFAADAPVRTRFLQRSMQVHAFRSRIWNSHVTTLVSAWTTACDRRLGPHPDPRRSIHVTGIRLRHPETGRRNEQGRYARVVSPLPVKRPRLAPRSLPRREAPDYFKPRLRSSASAVGMRPRNAR